MFVVVMFEATLKNRGLKMDEIFWESNKQLEERWRRHKRMMLIMPLVFVGCITLIVLTTALILNNFPFYVWLPVFLPTLAGQWWLANGGRWRK